MNAKVVTRKAIASDKDLIMNSWLQGQYYGSPYWVQMPEHDFYNFYAKHIMKLLNNPETEIDVAVLSEDENMIIGFVAYTGTSLHFAYTKKPYRGQGVLNLLLPKQIQSVTSTTLPGAAITKKKKLIFNPFLA